MTEAAGDLEPSARRAPARTAMRFVVLLGIVSLFGDMTYEGARSVTGPYLEVLGASATVVGIVAGFGELVGYGLRLVSGYISDRTRSYWPVTLVGYGVNLLAVPALALAGRWEIAALLMIAERAGKAIRTPPRDAMLSHATTEMGRGWGFGFHEAMDQTGAMIGPLIVAFILWMHGSYKTSFAFLLVPALVSLTMIVTARRLYPEPERFEAESTVLGHHAWSRTFWVYLAGVSFVAAGYADFPLIAYHFQRHAIVSKSGIPISYAVAMGVTAVAALALGRLFDRVGFVVVVAAALIGALFAPLVFFGGATLAYLGMALWGVGMAGQESIMRAVVADLIPANERAAGYGIFNAGFGVAWFLGSVLMGVLYGHSITLLVIFSVLIQLASLPVLWNVRRRLARPSPAP